MKKGTMILVTLIVILFSGCSAKMEKEEYGDTSIYSSYSYNLDELPYLEGNSTDILYGFSDILIDFHLLNSSITNAELPQSEQDAYSSLFSVLDQLHQSSGSSYDTIVNYSSQELKNECISAEISITTTNIIVFNTYKNLISELIEINGSSNMNISKVSFINYRLGRILTTEEKQALEHLQDMYNIINGHGNITIDFSEISLDDLIIQFKDSSYINEQLDESKIQIAYTILNELE